MTIDIGGGFTVITRAEWGARRPAIKGKLVTPVRVPRNLREGVAYHLQVGNVSSGPHGLQDYAMDKLGYSDSHYNVLVIDRKIYEMRGIDIKGGHSTDNNTAWIGVCVGGMNSDVDEKDLSALAAVHAWIEREFGRELPGRGHGHLPGAQTACPGPRINAWINDGMPGMPDTPVPSIPPWPGRHLKLRSPRMRGTDVRDWQDQMRKRGWRISVDSEFGPDCDRIAREFQAEKGLTVDGIVGPNTWAKSWRAPR